MDLKALKRLFWCAQSLQFCSTTRTSQFIRVHFSKHISSTVKTNASFTFATVVVGSVNSLSADYARFA